MFSWFQLANSMLLVNYEVQKSYYTNVLCVNQDKPDLKCNGKCHLSKQLAQDDQKESEPKAPTSESFHETTLITLQDELKCNYFHPVSDQIFFHSFPQKLSKGYGLTSLDPPRWS